MTQSGIPVPSGFVILAATFDQFLEKTDTTNQIEEILKYVDPKISESVEDASRKIQALISNASMPQDITLEIESGFKDLNAEYVAVRSSATAEDSASAAWAGQLESFLNTTESDMLQNVKQCWASLFTPRAIFYRFENKLDRQKISVAVVVQKMIQSEVSGISFSVHPVTQDRNQLIIEACFGLGEAIVSGSITPDSYIVQKEPLQILDKTVILQKRNIVRGANGDNAWINIPEEQGKKQKLTEGQILELATIIVRIEEHYGFPCDVEWALEKGVFHILQSRPITTLTG